MKRLPVMELLEGMIVATDVFSAYDSFIPVVKKHTVLTWKIIKWLRDHGISSVPIVTESPGAQLFIPKPAEPLLDEETREATVANIEKLFNITQISGEENFTTAYQVIKELDSVVERLVDTFSQDTGTLVNIADLKSYDEYTYHHSLSVAVLSIATAQTLGFSRSALNMVGRCAMLHDIGKTSVPIEIINKPSRLDAEEFALIKQHSSFGYKYLSSGKIGDHVFWEAVLCHHEKVDGTGYPFGLKGDRIPILSRILSVADVYDALTSQRSYRSPMQPAEAVEYLMGNAGTAFDFDIVRAFMRKLELYPVGTYVELSNEKAAIVLENQNTLRPVVQLVDNGEIIDLNKDRRYLSLTIRRILSGTILGEGSGEGRNSS